MRKILSKKPASGRAITSQSTRSVKLRVPSAIYKSLDKPRFDTKDCQTASFSHL